MNRSRLMTLRTDVFERGLVLLMSGALVIAIIMITSSAAEAVSQRVKNACRDDYFRHCPAYNVGSSQLRTCMTKAGKRKQLSHQCLRALIDTGQVPRKYLKKL